MTHLKKYWLWYLIAIIVVVVAIMAYYNWETIKGWFSGGSEEGRYSSTSAAKKQCVNVGGGDCIYYGLSVPCSECSKRGIPVV